MLKNETYAVAVGDLFIVAAGDEYEYRGNMKLFEFNISPDNTFGDQVVT